MVIFYSQDLTVLAWIEVVAILVHYQSSCNTGLLCSEAKQTSWPQVILKYQPPIGLDYRSSQTDPALLNAYYETNTDFLYFLWTDST